MYTITKQFSFSAAHKLPDLPEGHPCGRLHGHNYRVEVVLQAVKLWKPGFVRDYRELDALKAYLNAEFDHRDISVIPGSFGIPATAEHLAEWLFNWARYHWPEVVAVRVSETEQTWAEVRHGAPEELREAGRRPQNVRI